MDELPPHTRRSLRTATCTRENSTGGSYGPLDACANQNFRALQGHRHGRQKRLPSGGAIRTSSRLHGHVPGIRSGRQHRDLLHDRHGAHEPEVELGRSGSRAGPHGPARDSRRTVAHALDEAHPDPRHVGGSSPRTTADRGGRSGRSANPRRHLGLGFRPAVRSAETATSGSPHRQSATGLLWRRGTRKRDFRARPGLCALASPSQLLGQPAVPATQISPEPRRPTLRPLARPLHQQRHVEKQTRERRGRQWW
jgi:hypothetical protein